MTYRPTFGHVRSLGAAHLVRGRRVHLAVLAVSIATLAACGGDSDSSGPTTPPSLTVTGPQQVASAMVNGRRQCDYQFGIAASGGSAGTSVTLTGLTLEWRNLAGNPIGTPSTIDIPATDIRDDWFGTTTIANGQTRTTERHTWFSPHQSFRQLHVFRYKVSGQAAEQTATYTLSCQ